MYVRTLSCDRAQRKPCSVGELGESRERRRDIRAIDDAHLVASDEPRDGKAHRDAMIATASDTTARDRAALDDGAVGHFLDADAERAETRAHRCDAIGFLDAQLGRTADPRRSRRRG